MPGSRPRRAERRRADRPGAGARRRAGRWALAPLLLGLVAASACATLRAPGPEPAAGLVGLASWYGPRHQGRPTASGEPFDPMALTAAHRTLPLGSRVRVTNLENGRSVVVRVTDRGPYVAERVIDLSQAAATALGMLGAGVARVRLEPLPPGD